MIREFLRPATLNEALALKEQYGDHAVYMAGGARLNATPTRTNKKVAISLTGLSLQVPDLKRCEKTARGWEIGALLTLQQLKDNPELPEGVREAAGLIYSRNVRNQMTLGGEIAANLSTCLIVPALLALKARVELAEGPVLTVEEYQRQPAGLITKVIIPGDIQFCGNDKVLKSCASSPVVSASFAVTRIDDKICLGIALADVAKKPVRLHDIEPLAADYLANKMTREAFTKAVSEAVYPETDLHGSAGYKRQISGVLLSSLVTTFKVRGN